MYEDFLEEFVYNTAREIAMKLFGRFISKRKKRTKTNIPSPADQQLQALLEHEKELAGSSTELVAEEGAEETEEQKSERELNKLLKESIEKQKKATDTKNQEELKQREEYEGITEGLTPLNFHFTLFLFLVVITLLNLPSAITWAKNFDHVQRTIDASTVPAVMTISALAVIWQLNTPKTMVKGYPVLAMVFYGMAVVTIIYGLDSPFLLNNIIATVFVLVALHQLFAPNLVIPGLVVEEAEEEREHDEAEGGDGVEEVAEAIEDQKEEEDSDDDDDDEDDGGDDNDDETKELVKINKK